MSDVETTEVKKPQKQKKLGSFKPQTQAVILANKKRKAARHAKRMEAHKSAEKLAKLKRAANKKRIRKTQQVELG